jgi:trans-aconitate methyltransferase
MIEKARKFWETCAFKYAHLTDEKQLAAGSLAEYVHRKGFIDHIDWKGKSVIDYGCGGGYIAKYLFEKCGIIECHCVDIAIRSLETSMLTLDGYPCTFSQTPVELKQLKADILFSVACIQHFPDLAHLDDFLANVNESGVKTAMLQIREHRVTRFNNAYLSGEDYGNACRTNKDHISGRLSNYELKSDWKHDIMNYQYLIYELKK